MTNQEFEKELRDLWDKINMRGFYLKITCTDDIEGEFSIEAGKAIRNGLILQSVQYKIYKGLIKDMPLFVSCLYDDIVRLAKYSTIYVNIQ